MTQTVLGIDMGATNIRVGVVVDGKLAACHSTEVNRQGTDMDVVEQIFGLANELIMFKYKAIGVGVPSVVDEKALEIFEEFGTHMAKAVENIIYAYDPEMIVIGGSLKNAYPFYQASMHRVLQSFPYRHSIQNIKIEISDTENIAVLGAAALALSSIIKY